MVKVEELASPVKAAMQPPSQTAIARRAMSPRPRTGPLLFVPVRWQRVVFLKWLKRVHAWTGLWGALLFLLLGTSGFLLNHRAILKIDTGAPREVSAIDVRVPIGSIDNEAALDSWAKTTLGVLGKGRTPIPETRGAVAMLGRELPQADRLTRAFNLVDGRLTVSTVPGSAIVSVRRDSIGIPAMLKNLHLGTGLGVVWVLLIDTIAGALVTMSISGVLLWSRLHGRRLAAIGLATGSLTWALLAVLPNTGL